MRPARYHVPVNTEKIKQTEDLFGIEILSDILRGSTEGAILRKYGLSEGEFAVVRRDMERIVREKSDAAETTSHALRYFRNLVRERVFAARVAEYGLSGSQKMNLYNIVRGYQRVTYGVIFNLRRYISPSLWAFREDETPPDPVRFTPLIEGKYGFYDFDARNEIAKEKSLGNIFFDVVRSRRALTRFCAEHNCTKNEAANFVYMKRHKNGDLRYLARPVLPFVMKFRADIHPDWWYIYPEEVSGEYVRAVEAAAERCAAALR